MRPHIIDLMALNPFRTSPRRLTTALLCAAVLAAGLVAAPAGPASAATGCSVKYTVQNFWGTGLVAGFTFTTSVAVTGAYDTVADVAPAATLPSKDALVSLRCEPVWTNDAL